jgi:hypothetical protein
MIPADIWVVEKLPMLGSGKVDIVAVGKLVQERLGARPETIARAAG